MNSLTSRPPATGPLSGLLLLIAVPFVFKAAVLQTGMTGYAAQSSYKLAQLAAPVYWRWNYGKKHGWALLWPLDESWPSTGVWLKAALLALLLAATAIVSVLLLAGPLRLDPNQLKAGMDAKFALTPILAIAIVAYLFTFNAAMEELHFRAWIDQELHARFGSLAGMLASAALFAAMHLFIFADLPVATPAVLALVFGALALSGVAWSWLLRHPGGIHAAWLSHGLTDAALLTWGLFWLGYL